MHHRAQSSESEGGPNKHNGTNLLGENTALRSNSAIAGGTWLITIDNIYDSSSNVVVAAVVWAGKFSLTLSSHPSIAVHCRDIVFVWRTDDVSGRAAELYLPISILSSNQFCEEGPEGGRLSCVIGLIAPTSWFFKTLIASSDSCVMSVRRRGDSVAC